MEIVPSTAPVDLTSTFSSYVVANAGQIVSALLIILSILFVVRWFNKVAHRAW